MKGAGCKQITFLVDGKSYTKWFPRIFWKGEWVFIHDKTTPTKMVERDSRKEALAYSRQLIKEEVK